MVIFLRRFSIRLWSYKRSKCYLLTILSFLLIFAALYLISKNTQERHATYRFPSKSSYFLQPLTTWQQEIKRLDEFLERKTIACKVARDVDIVPVCLEDRTGRRLLDGKNVTIIAVESDNFSFAKKALDLGKDVRVTVIITSGSHLNLSAKSHLYEDGLIQKSKTERHLIDYLKESFKHLDTVNVFEIHQFGEKPVEPGLLTQLADSFLLRPVQQLHVFTTLARDSKLLYQWYSVFVKLKLDHDFDLYFTKRINDCILMNNENAPKCVYVTSWLRQTSERALIPEVKGSNAEQAKGILSLISKEVYKCSSVTFHSILLTFHENHKKNGLFLQPAKWPLCLRELQSPCTIFSFSYDEDDVFAKFLAQFDCNLCTKKVNEKNSMQCSKSQESIIDYLHTNTSIELVHFNLQGGEWSVLQQMIDNNLLQRIHQIIATVHVWFGEDYHHLIHYQMLLQQMSNLGFEVYFSEPLRDVSHPTGMNKNSFTKQCCFVIGWLRNQMKTE